MSDPKVYIEGLVARAREAHKAIEFASQKEVDDLCARIAWSGVSPDFVEDFSRLACEETGLGNLPSKLAKMKAKVKGTYRDMKGEKSVGIIEENPEKGLIKYAKPAGVVGAIIPTTNPEATPFCKVMSAIKTRNAIITAPHPRAQKTNKTAIDRIRKVIASQGFPEDLVINVEELSLDATQELMKQCDVILATGGGPMVKTAYSSGKPAYGVSAGNAVVIIDDSVELKETANKVKRSKTFDFATSCSAENSLLIEEKIYSNMISALEEEGGYLVSSDEKALLQKTLWHNGLLNRDIVAQPAERIAELAGITLPAGKSFFMVEETGIGPDYPFCQEKLSVVVTLYKWNDFDEAVDRVNRITGHNGPGHSCGIHTTNKNRARTLGERVRVSRIMVNQPQCLANSGAWTNGMPMSLTLGCGTWAGNAASENITWRHLMNTTWVSFPIPGEEPKDEELFGSDVMAESWT